MACFCPLLMQQSRRHTWLVRTTAGCAQPDAMLPLLIPTSDMVLEYAALSLCLKQTLWPTDAPVPADVAALEAKMTPALNISSGASFTHTVSLQAADGPTAFPRLRLSTGCTRLI